MQRRQHLYAAALNLDDLTHLFNSRYLEFADVATARAFYYGKYQEIIPLRQAASEGRMFLVEGAPPA